MFTVAFIWVKNLNSRLTSHLNKVYLRPSQTQLISLFDSEKHKTLHKTLTNCCFKPKLHFTDTVNPLSCKNMSYTVRRWDRASLTQWREPSVTQRWSRWLSVARMESSVGVWMFFFLSSSSPVMSQLCHISCHFQKNTALSMAVATRFEKSFEKMTFWLQTLWCLPFTDSHNVSLSPSAPQQRNKDNWI